MAIKIYPLVARTNAAQLGDNEFLSRPGDGLRVYRRQGDAYRPAAVFRARESLPRWGIPATP
jgi:hypothetical protein